MNTSRLKQSKNLWKYAFWTQILIVFNVFYFGWGKSDNHPDNLHKPNPYATKWGNLLRWIDKKR